MSEEKSDADIMADAREYIEKNGWTRGTLVDDNGAVCGMGGVAGSQGWLVHDPYSNPWSIRQECQPRMFEILNKVADAVGVRQNGDGHNDFVEWNDHIAEGKQDVLDAFAKAEKIERAGFDPDKGTVW